MPVPWRSDWAPLDKEILSPLYLCLRCQLFQIRHRLLAQMEQLLFTIHFIRILSHSNGHGNDGLCAHAHQFLDQPVLYWSKSRKAVKHHYTAL